MTTSLWALSVGAIGLGFVGTPLWPWLQSRLLGRNLAEHSLGEGMGLTLGAIGLVLLGAGLGWGLYGRRTRQNVSAPDPLRAVVPRLFDALRAGLGIDRFYGATAGRLALLAAWMADRFDRWVCSAAVRLAAGFAQFVGWTAREVDEEALNAGFDRASEQLRKGGREYSAAQTGQVQGYLFALAMTFAVLALILVAGGLR